MTATRWKLEGYDTFARERYELEGEFATEAEARAAAYQRLRELEETQPTSSTGGQADDGIQDRVYLVAPDGSKSRVLPPRE